MSLVTPIALAKNAFDATAEQIFYFNSSGGDQVVKNRLTIVNNTTSQVVYQDTVTSYNFNHTVLSNVLVNGQYYYYYFNTFNANNDMSSNSNSVQFYCYSAPSLTFTNIPVDNTIKSGSYNFEAHYTQSEGEYINYVIFYLYDSSNNQIGSSGEIYGQLVVSQSFNYTFNGFLNGNTYKIEVKGVTVNGTQISTGQITFLTKYYNPKLFSQINTENICDLSCVRITSNVVIANGITYNSPVYWYGISTNTDYIKWEEWYSAEDGVISQWSSPYALELIQYNDSVKWDGGYSISSNFTWSTWLYPHQLGLFAIIGTQTNGYTLTLTRMIPYGETDPKDFVELRGYVDGVLKVYQRSNYVGLMNNTSYYMIWVRKSGNTYSLILTEYEGTVTNTLQWEVTSNIVWNYLTDYVWFGESYYQETIAPVYLSNDMENLFPFKDIELINGVYDNMNITSDVTSAFSIDFPTWDYNTNFNCDFNGNTVGGNLDLLLSQLQYIRVKRRKSGTINWIDLKQYPINSLSALTFTFDDYYVPSLYDADYALVPVLSGDVEGDYIVNSISTKFNYVTISDQNKTFKLYNGVVFGGDTQNINVGTYIPLNAVYPIKVRNGKVNYATGTLSGTLLGYNYDATRKIDRADVVKQTNEFKEFLTDFNAKILKDWNGNIWLVRFDGSPTTGYNSSNGNSPVSVSATWTEQGKYDNQSDMYENGLVEVNE